MSNMYAAPHVWNLTAKILRENFPTSLHFEQASIERWVVGDIALAFAKRFTEDTGFDPLKFLDQCSPDPEHFPLSELWDV